MTYKVSVLITCYNHVSTVRRAIDSVLAQVTTFPVQIIVCDDGSTDGSRGIIQEYYDNNLLSCIEFPQHLGMMKNYAVGLSRCKGEYISLCDADDWFYSHNKLQKQVEFMDAHDDVALSVHDVLVERGNNITSVRSTAPITFDTLLKGSACIYAQSYMIRRSDLMAHVDMDEFIRKGFHVWDLPIVLTLVRHYKLARMPEFYGSVFCIMDESVTHTRDRIKRLKYVIGNHKIRFDFIWRYGCKVSTVLYLLYRFVRDMISIILKRW